MRQADLLHHVVGLVLISTDREQRVVTVSGDPLLIGKIHHVGIKLDSALPSRLTGWTTVAMPVADSSGSGDAPPLGNAVACWESAAPTPPDPILSLAMLTASAELRAALSGREAKRAKLLANQAGQALDGPGLALVARDGELLLATDPARRLLGLPASQKTDLSLANPFLWRGVRRMFENAWPEDELHLLPPSVPAPCRVTLREVDGVVVLAVYHGIERVRRKESDSTPTARYQFSDIITVSGRMRTVLEETRLAAKGSAPILLAGETGTGKELVAQAIHNASPRCNLAFLALNAGAIPKELIASELFGYEAGAFTGARRDGAPGKFELANNGTLFLDEIGEMPLDLQVNLLRVLEQREVTRLGGHRVIPIDVRIVAATNQDLRQALQEGRFRADLYYRLNVFEVQLPALRERPDDIPVLTQAFLEREAAAAGRQPWHIKQEVTDALLAHNWPGNVRELYNALKRATMLASGDCITLAELPPHLGRDRLESLSSGQPGPDHSPSRSLALIEHAEIQQAVQLAGGNVSRAARTLGISRGTIYRKLSQVSAQGVLE